MRIPRLRFLKQPFQKPLKRCRTTVSGAAWLCREPDIIDEARLTTPGTPTAITRAATPFGGPGALSFNGTSSNISVANAGSIQDLSTNAKGMTLSFWINPTSVTTGTLFDKTDGNVADIGWNVHFNKDHNEVATAGLYFVVECGTSNLFAQVSTPPTTGVWTHIVITYDGVTIASTAGTRIFYNGINQALTLDQAGSGTQSSDSARTLIIGNAQAAGSGNGFYSGAIENIIIDRQVWDAAVVQYMFRQPFGHLLPFPLNQSGGHKNATVNLTGTAATGAVSALPHAGGAVATFKRTRSVLGTKAGVRQAS